MANRNPWHYEVGYRLHSDVEKTGRFSTEYFDFPVKFATLDAAQATVNKLIRDFGDRAEFRIVEVR